MGEEVFLQSSKETGVSYRAASLIQRACENVSLYAAMERSNLYFIIVSYFSSLHIISKTFAMVMKRSILVVGLEVSSCKK